MGEKVEKGKRGNRRKRLERRAGGEGREEGERREPKSLGTWEECWGSGAQGQERL